MSFCDDLRVIERENSLSNRIENKINRTADEIIEGIKNLSRDAAKRVSDI